VSFGVTYDADFKEMNTDRDITIAIAVMSAFALVIAIVQTTNWNKREGKIVVDFITIIRFVSYLAGALANSFFVTMLGFSLWLFVVYKVMCLDLTFTP
jgi:meckelin